LYHHRRSSISAHYIPFTSATAAAAITKSSSDSKHVEKTAKPAETSKPKNNTKKQPFLIGVSIDDVDDDNSLEEQDPPKSSSIYIVLVVR
jgi:hypothetical protein